MTEFKYDLAISLLDRDLDIAKQVVDLFADPSRVFLYSERQMELVGHDGMDQFSSVFRRDSRTVLVLARKEWGQTQWTRVEETAIKNRGLTDGWEFITFVPLDGKESVPDWLPLTHIWGNIDRLGPAGLVGLLERKIAEQGSRRRPKSAADLHVRLERQKKEQLEREQFLRSQPGSDAANASFAQLVDALTRQSKQLGIHVSESQRGIVLTTDRLSLSVSWVRQYTNTLESSELQIKLWDAILSRDIDPNFSAKKSKNLILEFDTVIGVQGWREYKGQSRFFTPSELADHVLKALLLASAGGKPTL